MANGQSTYEADNGTIDYDRTTGIGGRAKVDDTLIFKTKPMPAPKWALPCDRRDLS
jgi:hypothetical protein